MPESVPTIVFIPGAWHPAETWDLVRSHIEPTYTTFALSLPSIGGSGTETHHDDAVYAQKLYAQLADEGKDIVVVAHSYGGMVGAQSSEEFLKKDRELRGKSGGIIAIVWVASIIQPLGNSIKSAYGTESMWNANLAKFLCNTNNTVTIDNRQTADEEYYSDCDRNVVDWIWKLLRPQSLSAWLSEITYVPYGQVLQTYIYCSRDRVVPPETQERLIGHAGGREKVKVVELESSHSPMLSMPKAVAAVVLEAAKEAVAAQ